MEVSTQIKVLVPQVNPIGEVDAPAGAYGVITGVFQRENRPYQAVIDLRGHQLSQKHLALQWAQEMGLILPEFRELPILLNLDAADFCEAAFVMDDWFAEQVSRMSGQWSALKRAVKGGE